MSLAVWAGGAQRQGECLLPALAEGGQGLVVPGRGDQSDAGRQAVGAQAGRHGQGGEVGQVGEVGVGAELAVEQHRLGFHLGQGAQGRRGRHHQGVEAGQGVVDPARQLGADVLGLVGVAGAVLLAVGDDVAHHRVDVRGFHAFQRHRALGDPGAVVELLGQCLEGFEVDLDQLGAQFAQLAQGGLEYRLVLRVAEELGAGRYCQARLGRHADPGAVGVLAAVGVGVVVAAGDLGHGQGVGHGQGEHRDAVQGAAGRHQAGVGQPALGRLEPDDVVEAGRHAAGAGGVGAQGEGHQAARHAAGRAGAGAAADVVGLEAVGHRAVGRAGADQAGGELVEVGLADEDGAGGAQTGHHRGVGFGRVGEFGAGGGGLPAGGVDVVLNGEGHAVQRQLAQVAVDGGQALGQGVELGLQLGGRGQADPGRVFAAQFGKQLGECAGLQVLGAIGLLPFAQGPAESAMGHLPRFLLVSKLMSTKQELCQLFNSLFEKDFSG